MDASITTLIWRSEDNLTVLSFDLFIDLGEQFRFVRLARKISLLSHLTGPNFFILFRFNYTYAKLFLTTVFFTSEATATFVISLL